jgi:hypothetical protein
MLHYRDPAYVRMSLTPMSDLIRSVLQSCGHEVTATAQARVCNYIHLLASAGKTDEQLIELGRAYLEEILNPDSRYSGC